MQIPEKDKQQQDTQTSQTDNKVEIVANETMKAMEEQINLQFQSFSSNLTEEQQKEIDKYLGEKQIRNRVYFVRHGKSERDEGNGNLQPIDAPLTKDAKGEFKALGKHLWDIGLNPCNTYILYHEGYDGVHMKRVTESAEIIEQQLKLGLEENRKDSHVVGADSTDKTNPHQAWRYMKTGLSTIEFCADMSSKLEEINDINIVCVIHKSNIGAIRNFFFKKNDAPVNLGHGGYQNTEVQEIDFIPGKIEGYKNWFDYGQDKTILNINSSNIYNGLYDILIKEGELKEYLEQFREGYLQIFELQNLVNVYFMKNPTLWEKYLLCDSYDMRVFCVAGLVESGKWEVVNEKLKELLDVEDFDTLEGLTDGLLLIFKKNQDLREKFLDLLSESPKIGSWIEEKLNNYKLKDEDPKTDIFLRYLTYQRQLRPIIKELRKKTLDDRITKGKDVIISLGFEGDKYEKMNDFLEGDGISLIEGEAGAGKSTKLLEIIEYLKPIDNNKLFPIYVSLGGNNLDQLKNKINNQTYALSDRYNLVYLFDAVDEANYSEEDKQSFLEYVKGLKGRVIITSRPNNFKEELGKDDLEILKLKSLDKDQIDEYILEYLSEDKQKLWKDWKEKKFIKDIESNPLMLSMVCKLLKEGDDLEGIDNIMDLYARIVEFRLWDWEEEKDIENIRNKDYEDRKQLLEDISYYTIIDEGNINEEDLLYLINKDDNIGVRTSGKKRDKKYEIECLNMIFKKENEEYEFIHETFREYFLAKKLYKEIKNNNFSGDNVFRLFTLFQYISFGCIDMLLYLLTEDEKLYLSIDIITYARYLSVNGKIKSIYLLGKIGGKRNIEFIKLFKNDKKDDIKIILIKVLGEIGGEENIEFIKSFKDGNFDFIIDIVLIHELGKTRSKENIAFIKQFKDYEVEYVRDKLIKVLGEIGGEENIEFMKSFQNDESEMVRSTLVKVLGKTRSKENIAFIKQLKDDNSHKVKNAIIKVLGEIGGEENIGFIKSFKNDESQIVRQTLIEVLLKKGWEENIKFIKQFKDDAHFFTRLKLIQILGKIGGEENIEFIKSFQNDESEVVRGEMLKILDLYK